MSAICDRCKWCVSRGCNDHEDVTGPYVPPPRLKPRAVGAMERAHDDWHSGGDCGCAFGEAWDNGWRPKVVGETCTCPNGPMPGHYVGCPLAGPFGLPRP